MDPRADVDFGGTAPLRARGTMWARTERPGLAHRAAIRMFGASLSAACAILRRVDGFCAVAQARTADARAGAS